MMILNVLLVVTIAITVYTLFTLNNYEDISKSSSPVPAASISTIALPPVATENTQAGIDALKKQLESENSKLLELRAQAQRIEMIRKETELEEARQLEQQMLEPEGAAPEAEAEIEANKNIRDASATSKATAVQAQIKNAVE